MNRPEKTAASAGETPDTWLEDHGDILFRYALRRIDSPETAEDLVQETFVAAIRSLDQFEGRAAIRTWLVGILRNKILDHLRKSARERSATESQHKELKLTDFFSTRGHWRQTLKKWPTDPQKALEDEDFWLVLDQCCKKMSQSLADAFRLREFDDLDSTEICKLLNISPSNLGVRLHRARLLLRACLEQNWFMHDR